MLGQFLIASHRVYPNFNIEVHGCDPFKIPDTYCRYLIVDPGYNNSIATFWAVPPKNASPHVYLYDELYCHNQDVREFSRQVQQKTMGQSFEAFLIDKHGSRRTETGGKTIGQQYSDAFEELGIRSVSTGSSFILVGDGGYVGHKTTNTGVQQCRSWLWIGPKGKPKLQVFHALCPNFCDEMRNYKNKVDPKSGRALDDPDQRRHSHGPDTFRYGVSHGLPFREPIRPRPTMSAAEKYVRETLRRQNRLRGGDYISL